ncbi:hypothetical protein Ade02nite_81000 [Paractinoplanes deccanensis]|uniref:Uncharacterized protein n=1 Tax=Paractinoplanes deccanensis TaxID=113561 RepID=A0ABQ3YHL5_9ACTN|nr:hypothetical protein [Actinoplanes deccanensis]GID79459.1 hypothetical protein Ade02nite_81000 [Actinoplanes deccanensis]
MFRSTLTRRVGSVVAAAVVASLLSTGVAGAAPAPTRFCSVLLGSEKDAAGQSVVLAEKCSTSRAIAAAVVPAASTKLMTWYADAGWKGTSADIYGSAGTCDSEGYSYTPNYVWQLQMSSIKGYGNCNRVWLQDHGGSNGIYALPFSFGATRYNDDVAWLNVYHQS